MNIPLRAKYTRASVKGIQRTKGGTSGASKKTRRKGVTQVNERTRMLVLVGGRKRVWTWV